MCVVIPSDRLIGNVAEPIHVIREHLPLQNNANKEESRSTPTSGKDSQSGGHRKYSLPSILMNAIEGIASHPSSFYAVIPNGLL